MKRFALVMLPALALFASPAMGQMQQAATSDARQIIASQDDSQLRADNLLGAKVTSGAGKDAAEIGAIQDLLFDSDNNLVAALIGIGGFLGIGEKTVAVSWDALEMVEQDGKVSFTAKLSREQLEQAPAFKSKEELKAAKARQQRLEQQQRQQPNPAMPQR
jgi:hypothetical protein